MIAILVDTIALTILMRLFARHEAENSIVYNVIIALIVGVSVFVASIAIGIFALLLIVPLLAWLLTTRLGCLTWGKAFLVAGIFAVYKIIMIFVFAAVFST